MITRSARTLLTLVLLSLVAACSSSSRPLVADTDYDSQYDFSRVRKIAIQPFNRTAADAVLISDMQVSRINQALAQAIFAQFPPSAQDAPSAGPAT